MEELQNLVINDIICTIRRNEEVGNLSSIDAINLIDLTTKLYIQIYSKYKEMGEFTMRLYDQSMELAGDKYEKSVEELQDEVKEMRNIIEGKNNKINEQEKLIKDLQQKLEELNKKV